jgi:phenylacetate-CoA ligase
VLQDRPHDFLADGFDSSSLKRSRSSGMSGQPLETLFDPESWLLSKFALKARRVWSDARWPLQRVLIVTELERRAVDESLEFGSWPYGIRHLSMRDGDRHNLEHIRKIRPTILYGYPSWLKRLADLADEQGERLPRIPLIYTSSEVLTFAVREQLERAFNGRVVDVYGTTEFKEIAVQCPHGHYHLNFESVFVESVPSAVDGTSQLLVTSLTNRAMPLIRYAVGELGTVSDTPCRCGRDSPQSTAPTGRVAELLVFPDESHVSPYLLTTAIEQQQGVSRFRLVHEAAWKLRVEIDAKPFLTSVQHEKLRASIKRYLPNDAQVDIVAADLLKGSGKVSAVTREF